MRTFPLVDVGSIMTSLQDAICVEVGPVDRERVARLTSENFDQAPVVVGGAQVGLVLRKHLESLVAGGQPLTATDSSIIKTSLPRSAPLGDVLKVIKQNEMVNVEAAGGGFSGFYHLADLNKHPVRAAMYPLFAELEMKMALLAARKIDDPWNWLVMLDKEKQARLVGYWELGKRENVDVGPLAGTTLSELSAIVAKTDELRKRLGFPRRNNWDEFFGNLVGLRNSVMHPVRPMFVSLGSVAAVHEQLGKVLTLLDRLDADELGNNGHTP
jgi:hypothetical protein